MTPDRWALIGEVFHQAAGMAPSERPSFLDRVCEGDAELRRQVESLLAADTPSQTPIEDAVVEAVRRFAEGEEGGDLIGKRIGHYTITGLIGKGGMGAVYRAVREADFRMEVAIKLLKRGTDTEAAMSRFRAERQMLAGLQHPNIARLLDGGATETGLPYFAMEYVEGTPLLDYAAELPIRRRLELFRSVCAAVHYAHQKMIVHHIAGAARTHDLSALIGPADGVVRVRSLVVEDHEVAHAEGAGRVWIDGAVNCGPVSRSPFAEHWGETGGTPRGKDGEIRVRMGKSFPQPRPEHSATTGVFASGYVENKGLSVAPQVGFGSEHRIDSIGSYWFYCNTSNVFVQKCLVCTTDLPHVTVFRTNFPATDRGGFHSYTDRHRACLFCG